VTATADPNPAMWTPPTGPGIVDGPRDREHIPTVVMADNQALADHLAGHIADVIHREVDRRGHCVLGLATGSTPIGIYRGLIERVQAGTLSFRDVITFNLDEYYPMDPDSIHSYRRFMWENLFSHVDIRPENVHIPDGSVPRADVERYGAEYETAIRAAGGIDLQILGIGRSGHIGFNEPGSPADSRTRVITLDTVTRKDAAADFFGVDNVPHEAITMGIATILEAREIVLIATGEHKAPIVRRAVEGEVTPDVTATFLARHPRATVYLDQAAAADLTRIGTPWLLQEVEWTPALTERAVVWLAEVTGKPILKLTAADYAEHHLSPLLSRAEGPGPINGEIFNRLMGKIRGRSRLPAGRRIVVFSPHPDDDVISMGGILRKLCQNDNRLTVAYLTSGNIAVFDHDVRRYLDFVERAAETLGVDDDRVAAFHRTVEETFAAKFPGAVDTPPIQRLKRFIREAEAVSAIEVVGLQAAAARFLNLPFYRTGAVRKCPIGEQDVRIVRELLEEVKPEFVFVAGDLSDPHGTHRLCLDAVEQALDQAAIPRPEVWFYRGAWQEWPLTEADCLVPLSQDELRWKRLAIFKHQSQKDTAPFPGGHDDREFWQRVEDRNLDTAARADRLGLPEYCAMEAYRIVPGQARGSTSPE